MRAAARSRKLAQQFQPVRSEEARPACGTLEADMDLVKSRICPDVDHRVLRTLGARAAFSELVTI